jgi:hypothetical protein
MAAQPLLNPFTSADMPREEARPSDALARLERIQAELEQDIARLVREIAEQRDPDDFKEEVSRSVLATFGYGVP